MPTYIIKQILETIDRSVVIATMRLLRLWDDMETRLKCPGVAATLPKGGFDHISTWRKNISVALSCESSDCFCWSLIFWS